MTASTKGSIKTLTDQLLAVVEILSAQNHELEILKRRCSRLEENDQAAMVAFTTFFHILSASNVSDLDSMASVFGGIIDEAGSLDLPSDSVTFLRSIERMLRTQHRIDAGANGQGLLSAQES